MQTFQINFLIIAFMIAQTWTQIKKIEPMNMVSENDGLNNNHCVITQATRDFVMLFRNYFKSIDMVIVGIRITFRNCLNFARSRWNNNMVWINTIWLLQCHATPCRTKSYICYVRLQCNSSLDNQNVEIMSSFLLSQTHNLFTSKMQCKIWIAEQTAPTW